MELTKEIDKANEKLNTTIESLQKEFIEFQEKQVIESEAKQQELQEKEGKAMEENNNEIKDILKKADELLAKETAQQEKEVGILISEAYEHLGDEKLTRLFTVAEHKAYAKELGVKVSGKESEIIKEIKDFLQK